MRRLRERSHEVDAWTPGLICEHLRRGLIVPEDWAQRLLAAGYRLDAELEAQLIAWESAESSR